MIEIKFTGDATETHDEMVEYLKKARPDIQGGVSMQLDAPENVTKQVIHEPVRATSPLSNEYYIVTIINDTLPIACTCKDFHYSIRRKRDKGVRHPLHVCKHMKQAEERFRRF